MGWRGCCAEALCNGALHIILTPRMSYGTGPPIRPNSFQPATISQYTPLDSADVDMLNSYFPRDAWLNPMVQYPLEVYLDGLLVGSS